MTDTQKGSQSSGGSVGTMTKTERIRQITDRLQSLDENKLAQVDNFIRETSNKP